MKKNYRQITSFILAAVLIALAGCSNIITPPRDNTEDGTVQITVNGGSSIARTLGPDERVFDQIVTRYVLSFEKLNSTSASPEDEILSGVTNKTVTLSQGTWEITATAYTYDLISDTQVPVGKGTVRVPVEARKSASANIIITPIMGGGDGWLDYYVSINYPVATATLTLIDMATDMLVPGTPIGLINPNQNNLNPLPLPAGYYLLQVSLESGGKTAGRTEVVHIYEGLYTEVRYQFGSHNFTTVIPLSEGVEENGEITPVSDFAYYSFPVTKGHPYTVSWKDLNSGDGTVAIWVNASYETDENLIYQPEGFIAESTGNVIIEVGPQQYGATGTYAIKYEKTLITSLSNGADWLPVTMTESGPAYYSFQVAKGHPYTVSWKDSYLGDGSQTLAIWVGGYYETSYDQFTIPLYQGDSFIAESTDNFIIVVEPQSQVPGTYAIKYKETPIIPLTEGAWKDGEITPESGPAYYSFEVKQDEYYEVSRKDMYSGDSNYTLDFWPRVYYETAEYLPIQPQGFIAELTGNVIIVVEPPYYGATGTYAVKYSKPIMVDSITLRDFPINGQVGIDLFNNTRNAWGEGTLSNGSGKIDLDDPVPSGDYYIAILDPNNDPYMVSKVVIDIANRIIYDSGDWDEPPPSPNSQ